MALTGYPADNLIFVEGMVEQTVFDIKRRTSSRLDTDWHDSTKAALEHFYPRL
jgi:hypothetical protein